MEMKKSVMYFSGGMILLLWITTSMAASPKMEEVKKPVVAAEQSAVVEPAMLELTLSPEKIMLQNELLKQQTKTLEESHSSLLDTVLWSIGGVFTMAILLVSYSWFSNNKLYQSDKAKMQEEFEAKLARSIGDMQLKEQEQRGVLVASLDQKLESIRDRNELGMVEMRGVVNDVRGQLEKLSGGNQEIIRELRESSQENHKKIAQCAADLRDVEFYVWRIRDIPENTLVTLFQGLESAVVAENKFHAGATVEKIRQTIADDFVSKGKKVSEELRDSFGRRLPRITNFLPKESMEIKKLLEDAM
ncbi:hypothetical protein KWH07_06170 [Xanthomonas campestris pv. zingibericola]|uniref:hypothetical protein n=1 Tax=Xanthomonas euvesicatoria TaxID=456327 RepID=UPI001C47A27F|nr:hypothetical protein [Xanthomonas euvesicatoria]MBV6857230.1 hypothetical protein [Xanthomonas campestris pv. zingibericola]